MLRPEAAIALLLVAAPALAQPPPAPSSPAGTNNGSTQTEQTNAEGGNSADNGKPKPLVAANLHANPAPNREGPLIVTVTAGDAPLQLQGLAVIDATRTVAGTASALDGDWTIRGVPDQQGCGLPATIPARALCRYTISPVLPPGHELGGRDGSDVPVGETKVRLRLWGEAGEPVVRELTMQRHAPVVQMVLLLLLGAGASILIGWWRDSARKGLQQLLAVRTALDALDRLPVATVFADALAPLRALGQTLAERIVNGDTVPEPEIQELRRRVGFAGYLLQVRGTTASTSADIATKDGLRRLAGSADGLATPLPIATVESLAQAIRAAFGGPPGGAPESATLFSGPARLPPMLATARASTIGVWLTSGEVLVTLILVALFVLLAAVNLWGPTWGSFPDMVAALLTGFGAYAGISGTIDALAQAARRKTGG